MSKFDISTQLSLRKKQQLIKERNTLNRLHQQNPPTLTATSELLPQQTEVEAGAADKVKGEEVVASSENDGESTTTVCDEKKKPPPSQEENASSAEFSPEFGNFLKLKKWDNVGHPTGRQREVVYAELTGEWSRPRVYICSTCTSKHVSLQVVIIIIIILLMEIEVKNKTGLMTKKEKEQ